MIFQDILTSSWKDYKHDPYPLDRRMKVIEDRGVQGMISENQRYLINEIVKRYANNGTYLEVGIFRGASLLSAVLGNNVRGIGIDNFSIDSKDYLESINKVVTNCNKFPEESKKLDFYFDDFRQAIPDLFDFEDKLKIDVYFYDGDHSYQAHKEGLEIMLPYLADKCFILIDDLTFAGVLRANKEFLEDHKEFKSLFRVRYKHRIENGVCKGIKSSVWGNGMQVLGRGIE